MGLSRGEFSAVQQRLMPMANQSAPEENCGTDWDLVVEGKLWADLKMFALLFACQCSSLVSNLSFKLP